MSTCKVSLEELKCKCGKCQQRTNPLFFRMINAARDYSSVKFVINSGDRCEVHNKNEGGSETSSHLKGLACDIACSNDRDRFIIIQALLKAGFKRIGISKNFIHVDYDCEKDINVIWMY